VRCGGIDEPLGASRHDLLRVLGRGLLDCGFAAVDANGRQVLKVEYRSKELDELSGLGIGRLH